MVPVPPAFAELRARMAALLRTQAPDIAVRWEEQSRTVALREPRAGSSPGDASVMTALVSSLADTLAADGAASDDLVALGLAFGADAFDRGDSVHHLLKGLDLMAAMILFAVETALADVTDSTAAAGVRLSRRLQQAVSLLALAAMQGHTQAMGDAMRDRFRHLRHDLRNPLGTIKSVLAMMDDETMPAEARTHPRFRAMAKRNARSLGELIADRLSDAQAALPSIGQQPVSLRTIACGVRRDLRAETEARSATVVVGSMRTLVVLDAAALELILHEVLLAALQESTPGDELHVQFGEVHDEQASVTLHCLPPRQLVSDLAARQRLVALAARMRGVLDEGEQQLTVRLPGRSADVVRLSEATPAAASSLSADVAALVDRPSTGREPSHDVRSPREREHGQSGSF
jgi:signal transduction histidine kinase